MSVKKTRDEHIGPEKLRRHVRILADLGKLAGESTELDVFLDRAVLQVARAVEIDHVKILRYRPVTADLLIVAGIGWKPGVVGVATLPSDLRSPPGRSFQTAEPLCVRRLDQQEEFEHSYVLKEHGIVSLANVPVLTDGSAWGVLEVDSTSERDFSEDTQEFMVAAGALIGSVVARQSRASAETRNLEAAAVEAHHGDILLREMQHRVKNNFQLILSSVSMQKRRHSSEEVRGALDKVASLIQAISLAHDQLAPKHGSQVVKLADYLRALCHSIRQQVEGIEIDVDADEVELPVDRALALGLILNEAAVNSIKHAFKGEDGRISVRLESGIGYGEGRLRIADNGGGFVTPREGGSGLKFMMSLARQIGGTLEQQSSGEGTTISVSFPVLA